MNKSVSKKESGNDKKSLQKKAILRHLIYNGEATITDLANEFHLSIPTITKLINELLVRGFITENGKRFHSGGRQPVLYVLNPQSGYFVGVEIGNSYLNIALTDFKGGIIESELNIPYLIEDTPESLDELCGVVRKFLGNVTVEPDRILNVCVNVPGRVCPQTGYSHSVFNFSKKNLAEVLTEKIGRNVCIDNDTRAMAYGEYVIGCAKGEKNVIFVNMAWGLGMGIIIDGKVYAGKSGYSGELGHMKAFNNQILCHCGKKGCLETEVSGRALHRVLLDRISKGEQSILSERVANGDMITLQDIIDAINGEDPVCIDAIEDIAKKLGQNLAGIINLFNPDMLVIGGPLSATGEYIIQPVKMAIKKYSLNLVNEDSKIVVSELKGTAGVLGACMMARSRLLDS